MPTKNFMPTDVHGGRTIIGYAHHEIHAGNHYVAHSYELDVDASSTLSILITAPTVKEAHLTGAIESSLAGRFTWSEAPNASGGTSITTYNSNRRSSNTSELVCTTDPTFVSVGTVLLQATIGTPGNPINALGGGVESREEWVLGDGVLYLLQFTSATANAEVSIILEWYEESDPT